MSLYIEEAYMFYNENNLKYKYSLYIKIYYNAYNIYKEQYNIIKESLNRALLLLVLKALF
jgi:hypothetical protein